MGIRPKSDSPELAAWACQAPGAVEQEEALAGFVGDAGAKAREVAVENIDLGSDGFSGS